MASTTNYNWTTPDDTNLVKDGASAIRTLGSAIDTTVFNNAAAAIAKTIVDAKGDIIAATAADTVARLAVGSNNQVLTADSSTATGLKWATPAGGGKVLQVVNATNNTNTENATTTYVDTGLTASITPSSATSKILVIANQTGLHIGNAAVGMYIRLMRGATDLGEFAGRVGFFQNNNNDRELGSVSYTYLDSPNTTSSTTYKTQMKADSASGNPRVNENGAYSSITLMEIGA